MTSHHYFYQGKLNNPYTPGNIVQAVAYPFPLEKDDEFTAILETHHSSLPVYISIEESLSLVGNIIEIGTKFVDLDIILVRINMPIWVRLLPVLFHPKVLLCQDYDGTEVEHIIDLKQNVMVISNKFITHFQEDGDNSISIDIYSVREYEAEFKQVRNFLEEKGIHGNL